MSVHFDPIRLVEFLAVISYIFGLVGIMSSRHEVRVQHAALIWSLEWFLSGEDVGSLLHILDISDLFEFGGADFPIMRLFEVLSRNEPGEFWESTCHFSCKMINIIIGLSANYDF